jgi:Family of unknown function (DUF6308)
MDESGRDSVKIGRFVIPVETAAQWVSIYTDSAVNALSATPYAYPLDNPDTKPWGVNATTLSKVLHRKRPASIALHDTWVQACYLGDGAPVPRDKYRSWGDYMTLVSLAMARDLRAQPSQLFGAPGGFQREAGSLAI